MLETTKDINDRYNLNYNPRILTELERKILNSDQINLKQMNLEDLETVEALSIYYNIQNKINQNIQNEQLHLMMLMKIVKLGDNDKGNLRLGCYYHAKGNLEKAKEHYLLSNLPEAKLNIYLFDPKDINILLDIFNTGYTNCHFLIAIHYLKDGNLNDSIKYAEYGIYKKCKRSMEMLETLLENINDFYMYLMGLKFTNKLIQNKIIELNPRINLEIINDKRNKTLVMYDEHLNDIAISGYSSELINRFP